MDNWTVEQLLSFDQVPGLTGKKGHQSLTEDAPQKATGPRTTSGIIL